MHAMGIIFLLLIVSTTTATSTAAAEAEPPGKNICVDTGDSPLNTTFQANIDSLSAALPTKASSTPLLFAMDTVGAAPDTVYGLALCRGDANASTCVACLAAAFPAARQLCPRSKEGIVFSDVCVARYSSLDYNTHAIIPPRNVLVEMNATIVPVLPGWDLGDPDAGSAAAVRRTVGGLLQETARHAAFNSTRRYATARMDVGGDYPPLYSLAQCTPDVTPGVCWDCLNAVCERATSNFAGKQEGRVMSVRCNVRYATDRFYGGEPMWHIAPPADRVVPQMAKPNHKSKRHLMILYILLLPLLLLFLTCMVKCVIKRFYRKGSLNKAKMHPNEFEELRCALDGGNSEFTVYEFSQVLEATRNFSEENKLGQGGFGPVYKGRFTSGMEMAVKRLASHSGQGFTEFKNEVQLVAKLQHTNLVRLLGCCSHGEEKILIYEYLPNKSLDFYIFDDARRTLLDWTRRLVIIEGIAQGLMYLHKHSRLRVVHRDLKASNILLDDKMNPKISDFGLAKILSTNDNTEGSTQRIVGTYGYMAPEYASEGLFSVKSDVFSFGVLLLEIISGKRTSNCHGYGVFINLLGYAWQLWKDGLSLQLVDASLVTECHKIEMMRCINIALLCVQENTADRPTMSQVVAMLASDGMTLPDPKHPPYFHIRLGNQDAATAIEPLISHYDLSVSVLYAR